MQLDENNEGSQQEEREKETGKQKYWRPDTPAHFSPHIDPILMLWEK